MEAAAGATAEHGEVAAGAAATAAAGGDDPHAGEVAAAARCMVHHERAVAACATVAGELARVARRLADLAAGAAADAVARRHAHVQHLAGGDREAGGDLGALAAGAAGDGPAGDAVREVALAGGATVTDDLDVHGDDAGRHGVGAVGAVVERHVGEHHGLLGSRSGAHRWRHGGDDPHLGRHQRHADHRDHHPSCCTHAIRPCAELA